MTAQSALSESQVTNASNQPGSDKINNFLNLAGNLRSLHSSKTAVDKALALGHLILSISSATDPGTTDTA